MSEWRITVTGPEQDYDDSWVSFEAGQDYRFEITECSTGAEVCRLRSATLEKIERIDGRISLTFAPLGSMSPQRSQEDAEDLAEAKAAVADPRPRKTLDEVMADIEGRH